jgi:hypothetical protein
MRKEISHTNFTRIMNESSGLDSITSWLVLTDGQVRMTGAGAGAALVEVRKPWLASWHMSCVTLNMNDSEAIMLFLIVIVN